MSLSVDVETNNDKNSVDSDDQNVTVTNEGEQVDTDSSGKSDDEGLQNKSLEDSDEFKAAVESKVSEILKERLTRERSKGASEQKAQDDEVINSLKSEIEDLKDKQSGLESENMRITFALDNSISHELVNVLKGSTVDELAKSLEAVRSSGLSDHRKQQVFDGKDYSDTDSDRVSQIVADIKSKLNIK